MIEAKYRPRPHSPGAECLIRDEPYYKVPAATRIAKFVSESTLRRWAIKGWTSFGLSLDVERRKGHLLVPELTALVLREFLGDHPLPKPGDPASVRQQFREAVKLTGFDWITPRSAYSRARTPHPSPK